VKLIQILLDYRHCQGWGSSVSVEVRLLAGWLGFNSWKG